MLAAVSALGLSMWVSTGSSELEVHVAGTAERAPVGVWLGAPETRELPLEFSDGTRVALGAGAEARIVSLLTRGVKLELEHGHARFEVMRRKDASFAVQAGPYQVLVTGTRFDVRWDPAEDTFEVALHEGQVQIVGCGFGEGRELAAGQTARAHCKQNDVEIAYNDRAGSRTWQRSAHSAAEAPTELVVVPEASVASASTEVPAPRARASASETHDSPDWRQLSRRGAYREALAAAEASGFEQQAGQLAAPELMMLADTAQHAGALSRARYAFELLRRRYAGSEEAAYAAFALGRLQFDGFGAHAEAARWFRTYLNEQPAGPFAREALGRLMEASQRTGDDVGARRLAQRYLRRYPSGPHAKLASRLADSD